MAWRSSSSSTGIIKLPKNRRLTFCVEGNISVGKTTFLQRIANETIEIRDLVKIVPEPIAKWQDVGPEHFNILHAFYAEPQRYAYTFQNYVFVTRVMQEKESASGIKPLRLMEISVFSDRMVFFCSVHESNWMNEMEISIYGSWFDPVIVSSLPASPDTCHKRMMIRKSSEEGGVTLDYLRGLHEKHEIWLLPSKGAGSGCLSASFQFIWRAPCLLGYKIGYSTWKEITCILASISNMTFSYTDETLPQLGSCSGCEHDIDFNKDVEAKQ
ncbi:hypothetical protein EJB05_12726, partial [Eragrostis curvula]